MDKPLADYLPEQKIWTKLLTTADENFQALVSNSKSDRHTRNNNKYGVIVVHLPVSTLDCEINKRQCSQFDGEDKENNFDRPQQMSLELPDGKLLCQDCMLEDHSECSSSCTGEDPTMSLYEGLILFYTAQCGKCDATIKKKKTSILRDGRKRICCLCSWEPSVDDFVWSDTVTGQSVCAHCHPKTEILSACVETFLVTDVYQLIFAYLLEYQNSTTFPPYIPARARWSPGVLTKEQLKKKFNILDPSEQVLSNAAAHFVLKMQYLLTKSLESVDPEEKYFIRNNYNRDYYTDLRNCWEEGVEFKIYRRCSLDDLQTGTVAIHLLAAFLREQTEFLRLLSIREKEYEKVYRKKLPEQFVCDLKLFFTLQEGYRVTEIFTDALEKIKSEPTQFNLEIDEEILARIFVSSKDRHGKHPYLCFI